MGFFSTNRKAGSRLVYMQKCSICIHEKRTEIDQALLLSKLPIRDISGHYALSKSALHRHKEHIAKDLINAHHADVACQAEELLQKLLDLKNDAERITIKAETESDLKTALSGIREQSRIVEILAKISGQIQQPHVALTVNNLSLAKIYNRLGRKIEEEIEINL